MLILLSSSSCGFTEKGDLVRDAVRTYGAQAYDEGLENAEFYICRAASVGSIVRRYGQEPKLFHAWRALCIGVDAPPFSPGVEDSSVVAGLEPFTNKGL